jgi:hypothetical protein
MATLSTPEGPSRHLPGRRYDHLFFAGMVVLLVVSVMVGFAHSYYLAGFFRAPLRSPILQIHAAVFSSWMLLLMVQATLVSVHRVGLHRKLGILGFALVCLLPVFGILAAGDSLSRLGDHAPNWILSFSITPFADMFNFAALAGWALRARANSPWHKRLILLATIALMRAALFRWPFAFVFHNQVRAILISYVGVLLLVVYDLWSLRRIHRATLWGALLLVFMQIARVPIGQTAMWHSFARWFGSLGF